MVALGALVLYIAAANPPAQPLWQLFLVGLGAAVLILAEAMRRASGRALHLTRAGLFDSEGREVARLGQIAEVERGTFAIKPSNGFTVKLTSPAPRAWAPGVWWRLGRRVGVGGVTSPVQAKAMAEILTALLAERAAAEDVHQTPAD